MRVVVEFDMVDMSMHKHETFFNHIVKKYQADIRSARIIEPYTNNPCCGPKSKCYTINENKLFSPDIDEDLICTCGKKYKDHFYFERGSSGWYWVWYPGNKCKEFQRANQK